MRSDIPQSKINANALTLDDLTIGMKITIHFKGRPTADNYVVADLPSSRMIGDLGPAADVTLRDENDEENRFSAADIGLLPHLGGFWNENYTTRSQQ